ncbi:MAG: hypothetical protein ACJAZS_000864, partial [Alteromonas naphthalenivorans]
QKIGNIYLLEGIIVPLYKLKSMFTEKIQKKISRESLKIESLN